MSNGAGNGELVQALLDILGELRTQREQHERRMAEHERRMADWRAEHETRMAEWRADHDQRMGEWAIIMQRINAKQDELDVSLRQGREDQRALSEQILEVAKRVRSLEETDKTLIPSVEALARYVQTIGAEIQSLKGRVDVVEKKVG